MKITTCGSTYMDIDAYAGCIALAELLRLQGSDARAVTTAVLNASVPKSYISDDMLAVKTYEPTADNTFILVDTTNPDYVDTFVDHGRIEAIYDHHTGFEAYWQERIGDKAVIDFIGAACTLIYEQWVSAGLLQRIKPHTAKLLAAGILDNTLNLKAVITTDRDRQAYARLLEIAELGENFAKEYFELCETEMARDLSKALENDRKDHRFEQADFVLTIVQLAVWDANDFLGTYMTGLQAYGRETGNEWCANILSVSDAASYFVAGSERVEQLLSALFDLKFEQGIAEADRVWLRKELFKHANGHGALG